MIDTIVVVALVALAGAYLARRFMKKGGSPCGCAGSGGCGSGSGGGCCGGANHGLKPMGECGGRK